METEITALNPLVDPEVGHSHNKLTFVDPSSSKILNIIMEQGEQYRVSHPEGIPALYQGQDVILHSVVGRLKIESTGRGYAKGFYPILENAEITYSPTSNPQTQLTITRPQYYFHLYSSSTVERIEPTTE